MKPFLTILFALCLLQSFGQTDSLLQRLIDSAKTQQQINKPVPIVKDTQKPVIKPPVVKKDTITSLTVIPLDSLAAQRDTLLSDGFLADSIRTDTVAIVPAVIINKPLRWQDDTAFLSLLSFTFNRSKNISLIKDGDIHAPRQKDFLFYLLVLVVLLLAIIKQLFPKYFQSLFKVLFQGAFRQKQTRELLMQETLPSLLMNILFIIVGGLFIALLADNYHWLPVSLPKLALYSVSILALVYMLKYMVIQFTGWAFQVKEPASTYGFIVFLVNKVIGLLLLPLLFLIAFSNGSLQQITITVAACAVIFMLLFRYIISLTVIRSTLNIHPIHFFIYLCAVELVPMLIIYKVVFIYIGKSE